MVEFAIQNGNADLGEYLDAAGFCFRGRNENVDIPRSPRQFRPQPSRPHSTKPTSPHQTMAQSVVHVPAQLHRRTEEQQQHQKDEQETSQNTRHRQTENSSVTQSETTSAPNRPRQNSLPPHRSRPQPTTQENQEAAETSPQNRDRCLDPTWEVLRKAQMQMRDRGLDVKICPTKEQWIQTKRESLQCGTPQSPIDIS